MLIALVGIDGAGKSVQSTLLKRRFSESNVPSQIQDRWRILNRDAFPECRFIHSSLTEIKDCIGEMEGPSRALFLFWAEAISSFKAFGCDFEGVTIADGYWLKHAASESVYGMPSEFIEACKLIFKMPDLTFYLRTSVEVALKRKSADRLNSYECGLDQQCSAEAFVRHQRLVVNVLERWKSKGNWITLDGEEDAETIANRIWDHVRPIINGVTRGVT